MLITTKLISLCLLALGARASLPNQSPVLSVSQSEASGSVTLEVSNCRPGDSVQVSFSLNAVAFTSGVSTVVPARRLPVQRVGAGGSTTTSLQVPASLANVSIWFQAQSLGSGQTSLVLGPFQLANRVPVGGTPPLLEAVQIPGGSYGMGDHAGVGLAHELPVHGVTIDGFWMDRFELTNDAYVDYLNAAYANGEISMASNDVYQVGGAGMLLAETWSWSSFTQVYWDGALFSVIQGRGQHPVVRVNWYGACAYANWRSDQEGLTPCYDPSNWSTDFQANGYRLPTEAEWEYAARGGAAAYTPYYWGNTIDGSHANYKDSGDPYDNGSTPVGYYDGNQLPLGADMVNGFGLYDMSGNVWEWCNDWYSDSAYAASTSNNPEGPASGITRILRGGRWHGAAEATRSANRYGGYPINCISTFGIRLISHR